MEEVRAECAELEAQEEEQAAFDAVALHDVRLQQVRLRACVQRDRERGRPLSAQEVAERYEAEVGKLTEEVQQLLEANAALALRARDLDASSPPAASVSGSPVSSDADAPWDAVMARQRSARLQREVQTAKSAAARVREEAQEARRLRCELAATCRCLRVQEWALAAAREELQAAAPPAREADRQVAELRRRCAELAGRRRELEARRVEGEREMEREAVELAAMHREVLGLRQACMAPAEVKKKSCALLRALDQEAGMTSEKRLRGLSLAAKLHQEVMLHAPSLLPLASRARAAMEEQFVRHGRLDALCAAQRQEISRVIAHDVLERQRSPRPRSPRPCPWGGGGGAGSPSPRSPSCRALAERFVAVGR